MARCFLRCGCSSESEEEDGIDGEARRFREVGCVNMGERGPSSVGKRGAKEVAMMMVSDEFRQMLCRKYAKQINIAPRVVPISTALKYQFNGGQS